LHVFVVSNFFLVLPELLLEFLNGPVNAAPEMRGEFVANHVVEVFGRGHYFHHGEAGIFEINCDI